MPFRLGRTLDPGRRRANLVLDDTPSAFILHTRQWRETNLTVVRREENKKKWSKGRERCQDDVEPFFNVALNYSYSIGTVYTLHYTIIS